MPPPARKRSRASANAPSAASIELVGGLAEKPSTIAKFRDGRLTDVEVVAADGTAFHAHALCITPGSEQAFSFPHRAGGLPRRVWEAPLDEGCNCGWVLRVF